MLRSMKTIYLILLILLPFTAMSAVYKWVDAEGKVHYGDKPKTGAEKVKLKKPSEYKARIPKSTNPTVKSEATESDEYSLVIATPQPHETLRSNEGMVNVSITVNPVPDSEIGAKYRLYLDGVLAEGETPDLEFKLSGVNRGSHRLKVVMVDKLGKELAKTAEISFHLRKAALGEKNKNKKNTPATNANNFTSNSNAGSTNYQPNYDSNNFNSN